MSSNRIVHIILGVSILLIAIMVVIHHFKIRKLSIELNNVKKELSKKPIDFGFPTYPNPSNSGFDWGDIEIFTNL